MLKNISMFKVKMFYNNKDMLIMKYTIIVNLNMLSM